jgi:hypothetical protein
MAWLTSYGSTNKVIDSESSRREVMTSFGLTPAVAYDRTVTDQTYRYVGMDYATAQTCLAALVTDPDTVAELVRENEGGAYTVRVNVQIIGDWTLLTP